MLIDTPMANLKILEDLNQQFIGDAKTILYGPKWSYRRPKGYQISNGEYMRTIREDDNNYLLILDLDGPNGLTENMFECAKFITRKFNQTFIKPTGRKGVHLPLLKVQFPISMKEEECVSHLCNFMYTLFLHWNIETNYGIKFGTKIQLWGDGPEGEYIDATMFTKSRKVRGFCRRFHPKTLEPFNVYSVPILLNTKYEDIDAYIHLDKLIEVREIKFQQFNWPKGYEKTLYKFIKLPHSIVSKRPFLRKGKEGECGGFDVMVEFLLSEMPPRIKEIWYSAHAPHYEMYVLAAWMNQMLIKMEWDLDARVEKIANIIHYHMPRKKDRDEGKLDYNITSYHVWFVCTRGSNGDGYKPPREYLKEG